MYGKLVDNYQCNGNAVKSDSPGWKQKFTFTALLAMKFILNLMMVAFLMALIILPMLAFVVFWWIASLISPKEKISKSN